MADIDQVILLHTGSPPTVENTIRSQRFRYFALTRSTFVTPRMARPTLARSGRFQTHSVARLELVEHVHVAVRAKIIAEHGTEHRQTPDMMSAAERGDLRPMGLEVWTL